MRRAGVPARRRTGLRRGLAAGLLGCRACGQGQPARVSRSRGSPVPHGAACGSGAVPGCGEFATASQWAGSWLHVGASGFSSHLGPLLCHLLMFSPDRLLLGQEGPGGSSPRLCCLSSLTWGGPSPLPASPGACSLGPGWVQALAWLLPRRPALLPARPCSASHQVSAGQWCRFLCRIPRPAQPFLQLCQPQGPYVPSSGSGARPLPSPGPGGRIPVVPPSASRAGPWVGAQAAGAVPSAGMCSVGALSQCQVPPGPTAPAPGWEAWVSLGGGSACLVSTASTLP